MTDDHNASDPADLVAWQWIRYSIAMFDTLVMTLLTQGTIFLFVAFGVIFGNEKALGPQWTTFLCFGLFIGALALNAGVWRYASSIRTAVQSAMEIENRIFSTEQSDARRITHLLAQHPLSAIKISGFLYYHLWGAALSLLTLGVVLTKTFL